MWQINKKKGAGLIEVIIGTAIIALSLVGVVTAFNLYVRSGLSTTQKLQAAFLAEEGLEAARSIRDRSWQEFSGLSTGVPYYLVFTNNRWEATTTVALIDEIFTRTIVVDEVYRKDSDDDIIPLSSADPKTLDSGTKKVTAVVSWGVFTETYVSYEYGTVDADLASFPSNNAGDGDAVQSFTTPAEAISVNSVELLLKRLFGTSASPIFLELRSGSAVGTIVGISNPVDPSTFETGALSWAAFTFPSQVTLSAGTEYFLRLRSTPDSTVAFSGSSGTVHWGYAQSGPSPYIGGVARRYVGRLGNEADQGQALSQYDFSFRVKRVGRGGEISLVTYLTNIFE